MYDGIMSPTQSPQNTILYDTLVALRTCSGYLHPRFTINFFDFGVVDHRDLVQVPDDFSSSIGKLTLQVVEVVVEDVWFAGGPLQLDVTRLTRLLGIMKLTIHLWPG